MNIGDKILFVNGETNFDNEIPCFFADHNGIPREYIIHGTIIQKNPENGGEIVYIYNEYAIIRYMDKSGKYTQLGFLPESFIIINSEPNYEIY